MKIITIEECDSTNRYITQLEPTAEGVIVMASSQTAGRGQRGNSWEAEPGKNLSFSAMWVPENFAATDQFAISEAVALAVVDTLSSSGINAKVKWPNDIYVGDRKICGILIEHSLTGATISRTIAGVGINVNQKKFISDAPNPVSVCQILGKDTELLPMLERYADYLGNRLRLIATDEGRREIHTEFQQNMWRHDNRPYPFRDRASDEKFRGIIRGVEPFGFLKVEKCVTGEIRKYAFKEVEFLLSEGI